MPVFDTAAWGTSSTDPTVPTNAPKPKTGFVDGLAATWKQESVWNPSIVRPSLEYPDDHAFDYKSYDKSYWPLVSVARNKDHADDLIKQFEKEKSNKEIMDNQSFVTGISTNILVGLTNPLNYIGLGPAKTVGMAALKASAGAVIGTALTEPVLHSHQVSRTLEDSAYNVGGAAVGGAVLGGSIKAIGNKLGHGSFGSEVNAPTLPTEGSTVLNEATGFGGGQSIGAAEATTRTMADAKLQSIPFLPASWSEPIMRFALPFAKSTNQRLSTSGLESTRNAQNILLRGSLATVENSKGVANQVPIEVAVGQRAGDLYTKLIETDKNLREAWWKKVEGGTYDSQAILTALKTMDPNLPDNYKLNRTSFDKVLKTYMADDKTIGSSMDEVVKRVEAGAKIREHLDADKIDFGLADKTKLIDIATGEKIVDPRKGIDTAMLGELRTQRAELAAEKASLKSERTTTGPLTPEEQLQHQSLQDKLAGHDHAIEAKIAEIEKKQAEFESIQVSSKTHKFAYEDGSHYLSRVFDKGRIVGNRHAKGWMTSRLQTNCKAWLVFSTIKSSSHLLAPLQWTLRTCTQTH